MDLKFYHRIAFGILLVYLALLLLFGHESKKRNRFLSSKDYLLPFTLNRLNSLLRILQDKELKFKSTLEQLDLIVFNDMVENNNSKPYRRKVYERYEDEINKFLAIRGQHVEANTGFFDHLLSISENNSFLMPRNPILSEIKNDTNPVIVTAANSEFYGELQATLFHIHKHLPDSKIIVYDLGLDANMRKKTMDNCKCELRLLGNYSEYKHVLDRKTYAWKPIIIQEVLKDNDLVMYFDSSVRIKSNKINSIVEAVKTTGFLARHIDIDFICYTNPKMFKWFGDYAHMYKYLWVTEANLLIMYKNFINTIFMKAWVTCALDKSCIAPPGSRLYRCCGCHRYDQSALLIISTFMFGHPASERMYRPAYSILNNEYSLFQINRREKMNYFPE